MGFNSVFKGLKYNENQYEMHKITKQRKHYTKSRHEKLHKLYCWRNILRLIE